MPNKPCAIPSVSSLKRLASKPVEVLRSAKRGKTEERSNEGICTGFLIPFQRKATSFSQKSLFPIVQKKVLSATAFFIFQLRFLPPTVRVLSDFWAFAGAIFVDSKSTSNVAFGRVVFLMIESGQQAAGFQKAS